MKTETVRLFREKTNKSWFMKWWPCILICALLFLPFIDYYGRKIQITQIVTFLINGIGVLAVVIYVIYTRDLAEAATATAKANIKLVESMQSRIMEQWEMRYIESEKLINGGDKLSEALHIEDKQLSHAEYDKFRHIKRKKILIFKPTNVGQRPVLLKRARFVICDTRSKVERPLDWEPSTPCVVPKDKEIELQVCYDMEGMIAARVGEIEYQDGDTTITIWLANPFYERRHEIEQEVEGTPA